MLHVALRHGTVFLNGGGKDIDVHGAAGLGFLTEIVQHGRSRVAYDFTALEALYNYIHKFEKLRFKLRKMSYKREVGKGRDRAPESMIILFLSTLQRYNIKKRKSSVLPFFYYKNTETQSFSSNKKNLRVFVSLHSINFHPSLCIPRQPLQWWYVVHQFCHALVMVEIDFTGFAITVLGYDDDAQAIGG